MSMARIERTSSIENEPRTLTIQQIQFARKAALYVVNTTTMKEAFEIFTEGMKEVTRVGSYNGLDEAGEGQECDCECECHPYSFKTTSRHQQLRLRDAHTAPF